MHASGLRNIRIERILRIHQRARFGIPGASCQRRKKDGSFSRRDGAVNFRKASARQASCGFIQRRDSSRSGASGLRFAKLKGREYAPGKSGLDLET
jgi:hypothetical protein